MNIHDDNQNDAALVARVLAGERAAFDPLLLRYYASVLRLCQRLLGPTPEAQDVAQDAALHAFLGLERLQEPARFGAWLHGIAANLARMALRRRRMLSLDNLPGEEPTVVLWSSVLPPPEDVHASREVHDAIVAALNDLSTVNREAVVRFFLEGYSYAEMAELLGVPVSTVRGRVFQGRQQLRRALEPLAHETLSPDRRALKEQPMAESELIRLTFDSIYAEAWAHHRTVLLRAEGSERVLALRVGKAEGDVIAQTLHGEQTPRPLMHDLALQLLAPAGVQITQVFIHSLAAHTYYATINMAQGQHSYTVEARPSDGLALAIRADAPIYTARALFNSASVPLDDLSIVGIRLFKDGQTVNEASMYSLTMPELAAKQPERAQSIEWNSAAMVAFALPQEHERSWLNLPLPRADESVCLVMNPAFWERMQEYMRQLRELREQVELTRRRDDK